MSDECEQIQNDELTVLESMFGNDCEGNLKCFFDFKLTFETLVVKDNKTGLKGVKINVRALMLSLIFPPNYPKAAPHIQITIRKVSTPDQKQIRYCAKLEKHLKVLVSR